MRLGWRIRSWNRNGSGFELLLLPSSETGALIPCILGEEAIASPLANAGGKVGLGNPETQLPHPSATVENLPCLWYRTRKRISPKRGSLPWKEHWCTVLHHVLAYFRDLASSCIGSVPQASHTISANLSFPICKMGWQSGLWSLLSVVVGWGSTVVYKRLPR